MSITLVIPDDALQRIQHAYAQRNETLSRNYVAGDWNQFNKANACIAREFWSLLNANVQQETTGAASAV